MKHPEASAEMISETSWILSKSIGYIYSKTWYLLACYKFDLFRFASAFRLNCRHLQFNRVQPLLPDIAACIGGSRETRFPNQVMQ